MGYVRQHYKLATTGKLGQDAPAETANPKGVGIGSKPSTHGMHGKKMKGKHSGGYGKKGSSKA